MEKTKILCFAGSMREESLNKKLAKVCVNELSKLNADAQFVDLRDFQIPLYDEDNLRANGFPNSVMELKKRFMESDALLISAPEYNSSITPLLKNVIDWVSVSLPNESPSALACYKGKTAALVSASPGGLGGLRGLFHLRDILQNIGVLVVPEMFSLSHASDAFDEDGELKDPSARAKVAKVITDLSKIAKNLKAAYATL